jgi:hypothetical protein
VPEQLCRDESKSNCGLRSAMLAQVLRAIGTKVMGGGGGGSAPRGRCTACGHHLAVVACKLCSPAAVVQEQCATCRLLCHCQHSLVATGNDVILTHLQENKIYIYIYIHMSLTGGLIWRGLGHASWHTSMGSVMQGRRRPWCSAHRCAYIGHHAVHRVHFQQNKLGEQCLARVLLAILQPGLL